VTYLLDTHTFIWWDTAPQKLSDRIRTLIQDPQNRILLSLVSVWEMQIKLQVGKLRLDLPLDEIISAQERKNHLGSLPIRLEHVFALQGLSLHHNDPFDRLLIAQAQTEGLSLLSKDGAFADYELDVIW
jgi:PIN domain nuclease of toxin-antitoxin system